jgi:hypothetical protein
MLSQTLQRIIDQHLTNAKELGDLAGVSTSTVYRWIAGQSQPDFDSIRLLVRHLPNRTAQEAILQAFTAGTDWHCTHQEYELDVNSDGCVDENDALDASIETVKRCGDSLASIRGAYRQPLSAEDTLEVLGLLNCVIQQATVTQRVLVEMREQRSRRKLKLAK